MSSLFFWWGDTRLAGAVDSLCRSGQKHDESQRRGCWGSGLEARGKFCLSAEYGTLGSFQLFSFISLRFCPFFSCVTWLKLGCISPVVLFRHSENCPGLRSWCYNSHAFSAVLTERAISAISKYHVIKLSFFLLFQQNRPLETCKPRVEYTISFKITVCWINLRVLDEMEGKFRHCIKIGSLERREGKWFEVLRAGF